MEPEISLPCVHKSQRLEPYLGHMNTVHTLTSYLFKFYFNISRNQDNSINIVTRLRTRWPEFDSRQG